LCHGEPLPDVTKLAATPKEIQWTSELPFQYDVLGVDEVVRIITGRGEMVGGSGIELLEPSK